MTYTLNLQGSVPSKKNLWRRRTGQKAYLPAEAVRELQALQLQIQSQWKRHVLETVYALHMDFAVPDGRSDLDNKATTLIDLLVKGGVLRNDSIARLPRFSVEARVTDGPEGVRVQVEAL